MLKRLFFTTFLSFVALAEDNGPLFDGDLDSKFNERIPTGSDRLPSGSNTSSPVGNYSLDSNGTAPVENDILAWDSNGTAPVGNDILTLDSNGTTPVYSGNLISGSSPSANNNHEAVYLAPNDLYSFENSSVWELDAKRLEILIKHKRAQASVIQFYSSASRLSKDYVSVYLQATNRPFIWSDFLRFYAINCRNKENVEICQKYGFRHAPMIKYFSAQSSESDPGTKLNTYTNSTHLLTHILRNLNSDYANGKCPFCFRLKFYGNELETLEDVWNFMTERCYELQHILVPVESLDDPNGIDRYYHVLKTLHELDGKEKSLLNPSPVVLKIYRIPKSHPLFQHAFEKINDWELIMLTRQSDEWYNDHKQLTKLRLLGQIPVNSNESTNKKCSSSRHGEYKMLKFLEIVSHLKDTGAKNKTESAFIGPFFVQHYF